jgi:type IV secretory pathway VirD2 relaxase
MCAVEKTKRFIKNGIDVFSYASKGNYNYTSSEIENMKSEIFSKGTGSFIEDKNNLVNDSKMVASDLRKVMSTICYGKI